MHTIPIDAHARIRRINVGVVRKPMNKWAPLVWAGCLVFSLGTWALFIYACHVIWTVTR